MLTLAKSQKDHFICPGQNYFVLINFIPWSYFDLLCLGTSYGN